MKAKGILKKWKVIEGNKLFLNEIKLNGFLGDLSSIVEKVVKIDNNFSVP